MTAVRIPSRFTTRVLEEGVSGEVAKVNVTDDVMAQSIGFLGSPSIPIDGLDVEPDARSSKAFEIMSRTYSDVGVRAGPPFARTDSKSGAGSGRREGS